MEVGITKIRTFQDLIAWQEAHKFILSIYSKTKIFPIEERYGLISQMRRSAVSISSNIAEGFGRKTQKDKNRFYEMALGSLVELENQIIISKDLGYISVQIFNELFLQAQTVGKLVNGLLRTSISKPLVS